MYILVAIMCLQAIRCNIHEFCGMGYKALHGVHGFCSVGSTILVQPYQYSFIAVSNQKYIYEF
jgi:hypothetical protein